MQSLDTALAKAWAGTTDDLLTWRRLHRDIPGESIHLGTCDRGFCSPSQDFRT
ncbi:MAG: hypothetical protein RIE73_05715 [Coleofasciculus sp. C1-SOL-03]|jgi:hypothetical protein|uniref:hypothetical protein n=1 Tax=Coleofasciculus sp. C1-SOL-03 TaxID=3069522 RepID=UPI0032F0A4F4